MILHLAMLDDWQTNADQPYTCASLAEEGFIHCSPEDSVTLAVINAFYRNVPDPLMVLLIDEQKLVPTVRWEAASPAPPPGVAAGTLFPHVYGRINRDAVIGKFLALRDANGYAVELAAWS